MIVDLQKQHGDQGLQIIVKMTNLELTPQELEYGGEMWQVDGQLVCYFFIIFRHLLASKVR